MGVDLNEFLRARGVSDAEIADAEGSGLLPLLTLDKVIFPGAPRYSEQALVETVGVSAEYARTLWRAMGFPALPEDEVAFYDDDLDALRGAAAPTPDFPVENVVRQTRAMSVAMARIAEQSTDDIVGTIAQLRAAGMSDREVSQFLVEVFKTDRFVDLLWYMFRRQFRAAAWRRMAPAAAVNGSGATVVGFVDLVRFAAITEKVADDELERLIVRFEEVAHDAIAEGGGRVVKMIGDAVMFVADDPMRAVSVALDLVDAYADDELLPPARAGLAIGNVLAREGDYFGPVVNLAARIVDVARPSRLVVSDELHRVLAPSEAFRFRVLPPKRLKGLGPTTLWAVRRA